MDPRVPSTRLSTEEQAPIHEFLAPAPNATYHIVEPEKGAPLVSSSCMLQRQCSALSLSVSSHPSVPLRH